VTQHLTHGIFVVVVILHLLIILLLSGVSPLGIAATTGLLYQP
jgi:hypothetical protein